MFGETFQRRAEAVTFARPVVESTGDSVAALLRECLHRGALGDVLADEPVGILVRAALP